MISLLLNGMMGGMLRGPCMCFAGVVAVVAMCGCVKCLRCRLRDCACCKRLLRTFGHDEFDDFELIMLVHEAMFLTTSNAKMTTVVQVTAGAHVVRTDPNSNGVFQQPLHLTVEQGVETIVVDLLDKHSRVLATMSLDTVAQVLEPAHQTEKLFGMKQKGKGIRNPKIKLTMVVEAAGDVEQGLLSGVSTDVNMLVQQQLAKVRQEAKAVHGVGLSDMEVLKLACSGPLEIFERLGQTSSVYVAVMGPPASKRWALGIWKDKSAFDAGAPTFKDVDLMKVQSVQSDATRNHVFIINYVDETRVRHAFTFRRTDRARDVWVDLLHRVIQSAREYRQAKKQAKFAVPSSAGRDAPSGCSSAHF